MRVSKGGIGHVASVIEEDLEDRETALQKPHREALADLCASVLTTRSANTGEWIPVLPRDCSEKSRERYISRFLANTMVSPLAVMRGFIPDLIEICGTEGRTAILMLDQSKISDGFECLMVSLRVGERAIPVAWKVVQTQGAIGFDVQKELLEDVKTLIPKGASIFLAGDRFYGTSSLISWCQTQGWLYRIRLKGNLIFEHEGGEITPLEAANLKLSSLVNARFHKTTVITNIGIVGDPGHKEPWFIAMDCNPTRHRTLDYGMRWGIECMFSDFKSRGFSITKTHLQHADRIERLLLVLTIALLWAVSTGMQPKLHRTTHSKKNSTDP